MKFEINPQLIITKNEFETLDNALKLCRDMDSATSMDDYNVYGGDCHYGCNVCPKRTRCSQLANECVFIVAHTALKEIIDMAVVK